MGGGETLKVDVSLSSWLMLLLDRGLDGVVDSMLPFLGLSGSVGDVSLLGDTSCCSGLCFWTVLDLSESV